MHNDDLHALDLQVIGRVKDAYRTQFSTAPDFIVHAPGRINMIGEHTDYNAGFVLPGAVPYGIYFAVGKSVDDHHAWRALDLGKSVSIGPDQLGDKHHDWADYILGACHHITGDAADVPPFNCVFSADLPRGSGLSSSSALTCGALLALQTMLDMKMTPKELALTAYQVERQFVGLQGGIMDQFACMLGRPGELICIDCCDQTYRHVPLDPSLHIFLLHTNVQRELTNSEYNARTRECRAAVELLRNYNDIDTLRDVSLDQLEKVRATMPDVLYRRARFVVEENQRVLTSIDCIASKDWSRLGELINASHRGLSGEYEVSCPELDFLQAYAARIPWIYGSRMMGGGFGGCTINVASKVPDQAFIDGVYDAYQKAFGFAPTHIPVSLAGGAQVVGP